MKTIHITINGMSCGHCAMAIKKELQKIEGITIENVAIGFADIQYDETKVSDEIIIGAVAEAGYSVQSLK